MAYVDDTQQGKGNLGGPELFLAPIGRIDKEKITEFFCNRCESVFEGAPNIQYESPNEEVADNLILIERGSYSCTSCNTALAEYREFKKNDESSEIGAAKPMAGMSEQNAVGTEDERQETEKSYAPEQNVQESVENESVIPERPRASEGDAKEEQPASEQEQVSEDAQQAEAIKSITGMSVFDDNARMLGVVEQVGLDSANVLSMCVVRNDGTKKNIALAQIKSIGEIIILSSESGSAAAAKPSSGCSKCGFENKSGSKFCEQCGTAL